MPDIKKLERKWIENFRHCSLINKDSGTFNKDYAFQLYYGKNNDLYPLSFPDGFAIHYLNAENISINDATDLFHSFLKFIGIDITKGLLYGHINDGQDQYLKFLNKCNNIFKMLAHYDKNLTINNPYKDNIAELNYLLRIECNDIHQLSIFDEPLDLPNLYSRFTNFPDGYEKDPVVGHLFNKIEHSNVSLFITGKAGTGKSTFIQYFATKTKKKLLMCAFTGIEDDEIKIFGKDSQQYKIIKETQTIVIDEVSMLRSDILEAIDYSLRKNGGDPQKVFGGKQILFVGDIFQLPPVTNETDEVDNRLFTEEYKSKYFFDAPAYKRLNPNYFEFKISYRQDKDKAFVEILDSIRLCEKNTQIIDRLNTRYYPKYIPKDDEFVITLASSNAIAHAENTRRLIALSYTLFKFEAEITGEFKEGKYPTNKVLELKKHSQIIFVKNDTARNWVNGTIAKIEFISDDMLEIKLQDGTIHKLEKTTWENRVYKYSNGKIVSELKGTFSQFPIKLAWAITVHKSQGLTFDKVAIDFGSGAFVNGQLYTALSRCRSLDGIALKKQITLQDIITDPRIISFHETEQLLNSIDLEI